MLKGTRVRVKIKAEARRWKSTWGGKGDMGTEKEKVTIRVQESVEGVTAGEVITTTGKAGDGEIKEIKDGKGVGVVEGKV